VKNIEKHYGLRKKRKLKKGNLITLKVETEKRERDEQYAYL
jgi:hypothetical protein